MSKAEQRLQPKLTQTDTDIHQWIAGGQPQTFDQNQADRYHPKYPEREAVTLGFTALLAIRGVHAVYNKIFRK